ncbi:type 4a pilus biogenesis protein PilO [Stenoxybacter acetivorans]|uniref:type 4a pilus biogenesis protein PilO n=1 Tax=Stenoxybacter acetivorans TaxID=422441 RepID=UPI0005684B8B|nr:type 4a pilus biogenesis protein PilO [Stenoxybacter acetivorans]
MDSKNLNLKEIDLKNLYKLGAPIQMGVAVLVGIAVLVLAWFLVLSSIRADTANLVVEEDKLRQEYEEKSIQAANLDAYQTELDNLHTSFNALLKRLPTEAEIPNLIQELHQAAATNGMRIDSLTPQAPVTEDSVERLPYTTSLTGNFDQISRFLRDVGHLSRIVTLDALTLRKDNKSDNLILNATANTYKALAAQATDSNTQDDDKTKNKK